MLENGDAEVGDPDFGKAAPCPSCGPQRQEAELERRRSQLPPELRGMTFDALTVRDDLQADNLDHWLEARRAAWAVANGEAERPWLILAGSLGWGKTRLAMAIINARLDHPEFGSPGLFVSAPDFLAELRAGMSNETMDLRMGAYREAPLLVMDDLGAEYHRQEGGWADEQLFRLLDHRYLYRLPTVITMNVPIEKLDNRIADRIQDTATGACQIIAYDIPSFRTKSVVL